MDEMHLERNNDDSMKIRKEIHSIEEMMMEMCVKEQISHIQNESLGKMFQLIG